MMTPDPPRLNNQVAKKKKHAMDCKYESALEWIKHLKPTDLRQRAAQLLPGFTASL